MTVKLDCRLDPERARKAKADLAAASEMDLRYDFLLGSVTFVVAGADLSADWGWIPLADFIAGLRHVCAELTEGKARAEFDFTDSDEKLVFERSGERVTVSATYAKGRGEASLAELSDAVEDEARVLREELLKAFPDLASNADFRRLMTPARG